mgnify:CR=1 FL=1
MFSAEKMSACSMPGSFCLKTASTCLMPGCFCWKTASHVSCQLLYKQKQPVASGGRLYGLKLVSEIDVYPDHRAETLHRIAVIEFVFLEQDVVQFQIQPEGVI